MELRVTIFQRKRGRFVYWHTVGLGALNTHDKGPNQRKVQQRLILALRKAVAKLPEHRLEALEPVRGRKLLTLALEFNLSGVGGRRRFFGKVPVVVEPRTRGRSSGCSDAFEVVYHPLDPTAWFVHESGRELVDEATAFFRERWADSDEDELKEYRADARDTLRLVAFAVEPTALERMLKKPESSTPLASMGASESKKGVELLRQLGSNQTERAADGTLQLGMPRSPYREQLQQMLCTKHMTPVLLVGQAGVGKSTLVAQLIHDRLLADDFPSHRNLDKAHQVWEVHGRRIIAGMSYMGQWEQRCVDLLAACHKHRVVLWVGDIAAWGRIGETRESERSLASFFSGPVARGELPIVAECTPEGYQQLQDDAPSLAGAFATIFVEPTDQALTMRLLVHEARQLEVSANTSFDPLAFRTIYELGGALGTSMAYPGKAIELLRALARTDGNAGASAQLARAAEHARSGTRIAAIKMVRGQAGLTLLKAKEAVDELLRTGSWPAWVSVKSRRSPVRICSLLDRNAERSAEPPEIGPAAVVQQLAARTGMPEVLLDADSVLDVDALEATFAGHIIGQSSAVTAMCNLVLRIKAGLTDASRPYGVFLFTGPTGTGKTEMAKGLASYLYGDSGRLLRFDMSEFNGPDAPARLIGDRYQPRGVLTSKVRAQPFCVVLLDEIEKADPSVLNLMLQLFDDGRLTDATGAVVDFTHAVVIMTSNLGAKNTPSVGFGGDEADRASDVAAAVRAFFPPELFNRIDKVVQYTPLASEAAHRIARRELESLLSRRGLTERNVFVRFTPAVVDMVVREGFNPRDGARSLKRYLEQNIGGFLSDLLSREPASAVRTLWLYVLDGQLRLHAEHMAEAQAYGEASSVEPMLEWSGQQLRESIPKACERAHALLNSPALGTLSETLSGHLHEHGDVDVFALESLRQELAKLADEFETQRLYDARIASLNSIEERQELEGETRQAQDFATEPLVIKNEGVVRVHSHGPRSLTPTLPLRTRTDILRSLGTLYFIERALERAADSAEHTVLLELTRVSRGAGTGLRSGRAAGLMEWLFAAYTGARGELDQLVSVSPFGDVHPQEVDGVQTGVHDQLVLKIVGPAVRSFFAVEHGTHIRESLSGGTEIVRVRVVDSRVETDPTRYANHLAARRQAFCAALESGVLRGALPEHPDQVLPIIRTYRFEPSGRRPSPVEVEDYPLMYTLRSSARELAQVMPTLWLLASGARPTSSAAKSPQEVQ